MHKFKIFKEDSKPFSRMFCSNFYQISPYFDSMLTPPNFTYHWQYVSAAC